MPVTETTVRIKADNRTRGAFKQVRGDLNKTKQATKELKTATAALLGTYALFRVAGKTLDVWRQFGATMADLSAITGATGKDLEFLKKKSLEFGEATTLSASQAAEAFKLVASAKPDLLENGKALAQVTKEAITLAEASGSTLPDAAKTLGVALNQYGAGAEEASRFINVLAAGSQKGASEIADTAEAIKVAGLVAAGSNTSFEEMNAAIQVMSTVALKGSEAGTGLRNVYLNLANQSNDKFKPALVGLTQAMENIREAGLSDVEMLEIFGKKNIVAAKALVNNAAKLGKMREAITGTTTAYEQASVKVDNLDGDMKKMGSVWESVALMIGETFNPALRASVQFLSWIAKVAKTVILTFQDLGNKIGATAAQLTALASFDLKAVKAIGEARDANAKKLEEEYNLLWNINGAQDALNKKTVEVDNTAKLEKIKADVEAENRVRLAAQRAANLKAFQDEQVQLAELHAGKLMALEEQLMSEQERMQLAFDNRAFMVEDAFQSELINDVRRKELLLQLEQQHEDDKLKIAEKAAKDKLAIQTRSLGAAAGIFDGLSALMSKSGKEQTKQSRMFARMSIVASTAQAIMNALAVTPYPLGVALAAGAALKGAAQLQAVGGSGGGSITRPSGTQAGTGSYEGISPPPSAEGYAPQQNSGGVTTVNMIGNDTSTFTGEQVNNMFDKISEAIERGDRVLFSSASRQAIEVNEVNAA